MSDIDDDEIAPKVGSSGVPFCDAACPSHDGKRCRITGHRPDRICEPAVEQMAEQIRTLVSAFAPPASPAGTVCHERPHGEYDPPCPLCDRAWRSQTPDMPADAPKRLQDSLTWTCLVCGNVHAITDAGIFAGAWMICCGCETVARQRAMSSESPPAIPHQMVTLQELMRTRATVVLQLGPGHGPVAYGHAKGLEEAASLIDRWWADLWRQT